MGFDIPLNNKNNNNKLYFRLEIKNRDFREKIGTIFFYCNLFFE